MVVIVEFSLIPIGVGESLSKTLAYALKELEKMNIKFQITPMCTIFEAESIDEAFNIVKACHEAFIKQGVKRVLTSVKVDDRRDVERRNMMEKVKSIEDKLKKM
ncbi:MAG: MTH1187 family thiamine-binding protein [Candidatus Bathyarchaeota archaeon]